MNELEKNQYMCSIAEGTIIFNMGRDKLYQLARSNQIPCFVKIGAITKINIPLMKEFLDNAAREGRQL